MSQRVAGEHSVLLMRAVIVIVFQAIAWLCVSAGLMATSAWAADPQQIMAELSANLFTALEKEPRAARRNADQVRPLVDQLLAPHFDSECAARLVLGVHWRTASPDQRQQFAAALYQRLLRTYADSVTDWTPDRFKLLPVVADPAALRVTVHTLITNSHGAVVPVDFRMHETEDDWKIFDVVVDGVSYVRNYHDDTDAEVTQKGLDATIARLQRTDASAIERAVPRAR
jgi:phospholipid transport system substrate-binding protein